MKKIFLFATMMVVVMVFSCTKKDESQKIPITASSEKVMELYNQAYIALSNMETEKLKGLVAGIKAEDPSFFMGQYMELLYQAHFGNNTDAYKKVAEEVVANKTKMSEGELLLQEIVKMQLTDANADISEVANKIITKYPKDFYGYYELGVYQWRNNIEGAIETFKLAAEKSDNPAVATNFLGYAYLDNKQYSEAAEAFDKYNELAPIANAQLSKGNYYMAIKDYANAYQCYQMAHEMDSVNFGIKEVEAAKLLMDSTSTVLSSGL